MTASPDVNAVAPAGRKNGAHDSASPQIQSSCGPFGDEVGEPDRVRDRVLDRHDARRRRDERPKVIGADGRVADVRDDRQPGDGLGDLCVVAAPSLRRPERSGGSWTITPNAPAAAAFDATCRAVARSPPTPTSSAARPTSVAAATSISRPISSADRAPNSPVLPAIVTARRPPSTARWRMRSKPPGPGRRPRGTAWAGRRRRCRAGTGRGSSPAVMYHTSQAVGNARPRREG